MDRRRFTLCSVAASASLVTPRIAAAALSDFSDADASAGLRTALERGAAAAVSRLGVQDGFFSNPKVKIPLPGLLQDAAGVARMFGMGKDLDELSLAMNRAAEAAVPRAKTLLTQAVRSMSVTDAKNILTGGETSVTDFFAAKTRAPLYEQFLPIVRDVTDRAGLARRYNALVAKLRLSGNDSKVENHVTDKALDGLFYMIGQEEIAIRRNPVGYGSDILKKVFGAL